LCGSDRVRLQGLEVLPGHLQRGELLRESRMHGSSSKQMEIVTPPARLSAHGNCPSFEGTQLPRGEVHQDGESHPYLSGQIREVGCSKNARSGRSTPDQAAEVAGIQRQLLERDISFPYISIYRDGFRVWPLEVECLLVAFIRVLGERTQDQRIEPLGDPRVDAGGARHLALRDRIQGLDVDYVLRVDAQGSHFLLYVNDKLVGQVTDADYAEGTVGLYAENLENVKTHIHFNTLSVREVKFSMMCTVLDGGTVYVRSGPSKSNPQVGILSSGDTVQAKGISSNQWIQVIVEGSNEPGWVSWSDAAIRRILSCTPSVDLFPIVNP